MNKIFFVFVFVLLNLSCSEGDIIENNVNFTADLENCSNGNDFVFFKIDTMSNRAISLSFTNTTFELNTIPSDLTFTITLNETSNTLIYREFNVSINASAYFCASVPPANITVNQELISSNGDAVINYTIKSETDTEITYTRTITLSNITLEGSGNTIRQEVFNLGSDEFTITK